MVLPCQREKQLIYHCHYRLCRQVALADSLSANQKAELILDPNNLASVDETIVKEVFKSLTESQDDDDDEEQLSQFFQAFANISKQVNA